MSKGIIQIKSANDFETSYNKLRAALDNNPLIKIVAELDHQKNAANVDLDLGKTRIILFGNPLLGTPLMQSNINIAIDLPQKFLVTEQEDGVYISFNDPTYIKERHGVIDKDGVIEKISGALYKLAGVAAS